jgi:hypothetical protein
MPHTSEISNAVGKIWKTMAVNRKLIPLVPRSIALVKPPVCLERWKLRSSLSKCSYTLQATLRIAFCATLAKTALRSSWDTVAPIRVKPSVHSVSVKMGRICIAGSSLHATIIEPATVVAVPPTAAKSIFIESTMFLK